MLEVMVSFEGWIWALIASVPDLCILFTFAHFITGHVQTQTESAVFFSLSHSFLPEHHANMSV